MILVNWVHYRARLVIHRQVFSPGALRLSIRLYTEIEETERGERGSRGVDPIMTEVTIKGSSNLAKKPR